ncbi:YbfJ family protein [Bacillus sp. YC2]|uniref:DUF2606 family protein n=1 Tax=Bacillus sp. YC2 TaxID=2861287 RepID=UPI001CA72C6C|nr:DUF2606 family protein [Bacillus sp. YC2]MBY8914353.1 YbfJ family protein [Bacillus sp. YC2]
MYSTTLNIGQINKKVILFIFVLVLFGCSKDDDSASDQKALPVTFHLEDADGSPADGVTVTVVKAPKSDQEPNIERGEILGKTDQNGDIQWKSGRKGTYAVAFQTDEMSETRNVTLSDHHKNTVINCKLKTYK